MQRKKQTMTESQPTDDHKISKANEASERASGRVGGLVVDPQRAKYDFVIGVKRTDENMVFLKVNQARKETALNFVSMLISIK